MRIGFFNSYGEAAITLVQLLVGEDWHAQECRKLWHSHRGHTRPQGPHNSGKA